MNIKRTFISYLQLFNYLHKLFEHKTNYIFVHNKTLKHNIISLYLLRWISTNIFLPQVKRHTFNSSKKWILAIFIYIFNLNYLKTFIVSLKCNNY